MTDAALACDDAALVRDHGARWIWGDPADGIPADAPLHTLLLAASRVMGAYYTSLLARQGLRISGLCQPQLTQGIVNIG